MIEPEQPYRGGNLLIWCKRMWQFCRSLQVLPGPGIEIRRTPGGVVISIRQKKGTAGPLVICPFGELMTVAGEEETTTRAIRGGAIYAGDRNMNIEPQELNLEADGVWLVSIKVTCEANRDDDHEIWLPNLLTATTPTGDWDKKVWTDGTDYDDNTPLDIDTGEGVCVIPIGKLTIADGSAKLDRVGCGNITITQCGGTLSFTRGAA